MLWTVPSDNIIEITAWLNKTNLDVTQLTLQRVSIVFVPELTLRARQDSKTSHGSFDVCLLYVRLVSPSVCMISSHLFIWFEWHLPKWYNCMYMSVLLNNVNTNILWRCWTRKSDGTIKPFVLGQWTITKLQKANCVSLFPKVIIHYVERGSGEWLLSEKLFSKRKRKNMPRILRLTIWLI